MGTEDRNITSVGRYTPPTYSESAPRAVELGPRQPPPTSFFLHESLPIPFLSWRFQSFRHKSRIFKSIHN